MEPYTVEGLGVGMPVVPESWEYKRYDCKPSDQYANSTWCVFLDKDRHITLSILHSSDTNIAYYINEAWSHTSINKLRADRDIAEWSKLYGMPRRIYELPERRGFPKAIIATWGGIEFEPLTPSDLHLRAQGRNPYVGIMVDFLNNTMRSAQAGLPVYSLSGISGFVYVASFDGKGKGTRRFFAADPSQMKRDATLGGEASQREVQPSNTPNPPQAPAAPSTRPDAPIIIGGDERVKACGDTGEIVGLDPQGNGFLSVRSGPGDQPFQEKDRLFNGSEVYICARSGPWLAVVYSDKRDLEQNCGVDKPWRTRQPYTGPCQYGWIYSTYVRIAETGLAPQSQSKPRQEPTDISGPGAPKPGQLGEASHVPNDSIKCAVASAAMRAKNRNEIQDWTDNRLSVESEALKATLHKIDPPGGGRCTIPAAEASRFQRWLEIASEQLRRNLVRGYALGGNIRLGSKIGDVHIVSVTGVNDSASIKFWVGFDNAADQCRLMASAHNKTHGIDDDDNVKVANGISFACSVDVLRAAKYRIYERRAACGRKPVVTMIYPGDEEGNIPINKYEMVGFEEQMPADGILRPVKTVWMNHTPDWSGGGYVHHDEGKILKDDDYHVPELIDTFKTLCPVDYDQLFHNYDVVY